MKYFLSLIILFHFTAAAQTDSSYLIEIPFRYLKIGEDFSCVYRSKVQVIQNDSVWNSLQTLCKASDTSKPDFTKYTLWQRSTMGDCHAIFTHRLFMDTLLKKMIWIITDHYGGCRGARFEDFRIQFSKPPAGYTFELRDENKEKW